MISLAHQFSTCYIYFRVTFTFAPFLHSQLEGHNPGKKRWSRVEKAMTELRFTRGSPFLDLHVMLAFCHDRVNASTAKLAIAKEMIEVWRGKCTYVPVYSGLYRETIRSLTSNPI